MGWKECVGWLIVLKHQARSCDDFFSCTESTWKKAMTFIVFSVIHPDFKGETHDPQSL